MADTITAFYSFVAGTPAQSTQVNSNFSVFRGDFIPVNTDTQTGSDLTHDIGQATHRWKDGYFDRLIFAGDTITGNDIGTTSTGGMVHNSPVAHRFNVAGTVTGEIPAVGIAQLSPNRLDNGTTSVAWGGMASIIWGQNTNTVSTLGAATFGTSEFLMPNSTMTIETVGRPIVYEFYGVVLGGTTASQWQFKWNGGDTSGTNIEMFLYRGSTQVASTKIRFPGLGHTGPKEMGFMDMSCPAGTHNYYFSLVGSGSHVVSHRNNGARVREI